MLKKILFATVLVLASVGCKTQPPAETVAAADADADAGTDDAVQAASDATATLAEDVTASK